MKSHAASMLDKQASADRRQVKYLTTIGDPGSLPSIEFERQVPILNRDRLSIRVPRGMTVMEIEEFMYHTGWGEHFHDWWRASGSTRAKNGEIAV
jgi:hypothetical protein